MTPSLEDPPARHNAFATTRGNREGVAWHG